MHKRTYANPREAYELLNSWTQIQTSYETQFRGKKVLDVSVLFQGEQPQFATVHYTIPDRLVLGYEFIDLKNKMLLDAPQNIPFRGLKGLPFLSPSELRKVPLDFLVRE